MSALWSAGGRLRYGAIGAVVYLLLIAAGHYAHTYYQIAFVPLAAIVSGRGSLVSG